MAATNTRRLRWTRRAGLASAALAATACRLPAPVLNREASRAGVPVASLADVQTLHLNAGADPESIDPQQVAYLTDIGVVMRVFSNLLTFNARGELVPDSAERLPVASADGRTITATLREGLMYSDGRPLTAHHFEYGWKRHLDPRTAGEYAFTGYVIEGAEALHSARGAPASRLEELRAALGVRARDNRTLEFRLVTPAPWFLSVVATWCGLPVREDLITAAGHAWTEPDTYIGNGPYILRDWERQNRMLFEANPRYHRGAPHVKHVEVNMIGEPSVAIAAYKNGELDVLSVQHEDMAVVMGDASLRRELQQYPGSCTTYLGFNVTRAPFDQVAVRRAFSLAIDRRAYVAGVLGGLGAPAAQLTPPRLPGHYSDLTGQTYDVRLARRLLSDAGFTGGRGFPPVRFTYAGGPRSRLRVEALVEQLRQTLGVQVVADPVDGRTYTTLLRSVETTPQLFLLGWCQDYPDPHNWYTTLFHSKATLSSTGWTNPAFDRLTESADEERNSRRRNALYRNAAQILVDEAPVAFLYHSTVARLVKPHVAGLAQNPLEYFEGQSSLDTLRILKR